MTRRSGAADSLMDSLVDALKVPRENVIEFFMHRTRRGRTLITVRYDASDIKAPPIETVYELTPVADPPTADTALPAFTVTGDIDTPPAPRRRFWRKKTDGEK